MWSLRFFGLAVQLFLALLGRIDAETNTSPTGHIHVRTRFVSPNATLPEVSTRIHGGQFAREKDYPYAVFILILRTNDIQQTFLTCTGSIVDEKWVLTAAHCVLPRKKPPRIIVVAGKANLQLYYNVRRHIPFEDDVKETILGVQERRVTRVYMHPGYESPESGHDLALLLLDNPFEINDAVKTLPLSKTKMDSRQSCMVLGWGLNDDNFQSFRLMYAQPVYASTPEIKCIYMSQGPFICLEQGGGGICRGDSGSPLVCNNEIWGVASFAMSCKENPSPSEQEEEYFCQVYPDINWIHNVLTGTGTSPKVRNIALFFAFVVWSLV